MMHTSIIRRFCAWWAVSQVALWIVFMLVRLAHHYKFDEAVVVGLLTTPVLVAIGSLAAPIREGKLS
jgi:hypothetical protein